MATIIGLFLSMVVVGVLFMIIEIAMAFNVFSLYVKELEEREAKKVDKDN